MSVAVAPEIKRCAACLVEQPCGEFYRRRAGSEALQSECRACSKRRVAQLKKTARAVAMGDALARENELRRREWAEMVRTRPYYAAVQDALDRGQEASRARTLALMAAVGTGSA